MRLIYVSRRWIIKAFLKAIRFVAGIFVASGLYLLYQESQELSKGSSGSPMGMLPLLGFVIGAGGIVGVSSFLLDQGRHIYASANGMRLAKVKWLSGVPEEVFVGAALDLRKRIAQEATVRETFLRERGKVLEQLRPLQVDESVRSWTANQMAAARSFYLLGIAPGAAVDGAEKKRLGEEVFSQAFAENGLDEFQKHFPSLQNIGPVGETEWSIAGGPKYVLTTDRLLIPGGRNQGWSSVPLSEVAELTVRL
jgi:hypothetical protein